MFNSLLIKCVRVSVNQNSDLKDAKITDFNSVRVYPNLNSISLLNEAMAHVDYFIYFQM